jgi:hypothetical protein
VFPISLRLHNLAAKLSERERKISNINISTLVICISFITRYREKERKKSAYLSVSIFWEEIEENPV